MKAIIFDMDGVLVDSMPYHAEAWQQAFEEFGKKAGFSNMVLHARDYALPFYQKIGYELIGPSYKLFDVLQHFEMRKEL